MSGVTSPILTPDSRIDGIERDGDYANDGSANGGYKYGGGIDTARIFGPQWPIFTGTAGDRQGIALDPLWTFDQSQAGLVTNNEEGQAAQYFNGGVTQAPVDEGMNPHYTANDVDEIQSSWNSGNVNMSPYQVDTNIVGPVTGNSETMNGNTLQPDYNPQGQYGASTGGGTSQHETATAYYLSQVDQVQRDYAASALFASV